MGRLNPSLIKSGTLACVISLKVSRDLSLSLILHAEIYMSNGTPGQGNSVNGGPPTASNLAGGPGGTG
jgi:hypothetical protein